ncbi:MAG TPA: PAS domain-containing protein [Actinomycetota bacterium]
MVDAAWASKTNALRRDTVSQAVMFAAERLLLSEDWRAVGHDVLERLGAAASASRATVIENSVDRDGTVRHRIAVEWCADGVDPMIGDPSLLGAPWSERFPHWIERLSAGEAVQGIVAEQPRPERDELTRQGIVSVAYLPILVDDEWWGAVGFDECALARTWAPEDIEGLRTAAALLGAAIRRRRQEERLRKTEARYRSVVEQIPAVTYFDVVEDDGVRMGFLSPQIESLLGYPYEHFLVDGDRWFDIVHPDDQARVDEAARRAGAEKVPFDEEYRMRAADGSWVWVHDTTLPVHDEHGQITHFQGFLLDVTARREAERHLAEAESRYRGVVETLPAVTYVDQPVVRDGVHETVLTFVSPQIETLLGYPSARFVDERDFWFTLMHPDDYARLDSSGELDPTSLEPFSEEYRMRHADGRWVWVQDTTVAVCDDRGEVAYFQGFLLDVTARKEAEARALTTEARYREFLERIPAVTYTDIPEDDRVAMGYVSPQIDAILGRPAQDFIDDERLWGRLIHPEDYARMQAANAFDPEDTAPFDQEYRMQRADGSWVWVHDTSTAVFGHDGAVEYFQGFMVDVTARKHAEEAARRADERFRVLVEQMPAIVYTERVEPGTPTVTAMDYVSPQVEAILGHPIASWMQDVDFWERIVHPDDLAATKAAIAHVNETGEPLSTDYRVFAADGRIVWLHEEAILIRRPDGTPDYWLGFLLDVTARRLAEEQIRVAEERFRMIVEHTPAITYQEGVSGAVYDPSQTFLYMSPQVEQVLGYPQDAWGRTPDFWMQVVHPDDLEAVIELSARTALSGEPYRQEYRMIAADGHEVWLHDESHLIRDSDGAPVMWQGVMLDVTERKIAEEQSRRAQERLQALVDHVPAVVYVQSPDADPSKFWISPQVQALLGYTPHEWAWTEDFWLEHVHPDDRAQAAEIDAGTDASREPCAMEYRFRRADGTYVWLHDEAVFLETPEGGFWQGFLFDITSQKEGEQQIASAERRYRATVEHLPAIVYREPPVHARSREQLYISPQIREVFGYTPDDWRAGSPDFWREHIHPEDRERVMAANATADATKEPYAQDYRFRRADGGFVWIHDEATFVEEADGDGWWQGFMFDITERMTAELHLREAEEKFRTIVEHNPAVIYTQEFDPSSPSLSQTTYISPRQADVFGYSVEEVLHDPTLWARMIHHDDRERVHAADVDSNDGGVNHFSLEYRMLAKDGRVVWVQDDAQLVSIEGRPPFWQGFLLDITERKHAEEQLARALEVEREASRRLRALDEMKNTFLQAVSHDLRTPLAAILGLAITLERGDVHLEERDARDLAHRIAGNARRLDRLVANLLDLDRLARGIVTPKLVPTEVGALVQRVVAESELVADSRIRSTFDEVTIPIDGAKVERIVENLIANTARHTPGDATIWIRVQAEDDGVLLVVEDDGPGIAPELRESIFEPFLQGPDAPQHSPGVGVGLTLVRRFAELHGGRAWVEERAGGGASFRVFLPREPLPPIVGDEA